MRFIKFSAGFILMFLALTIGVSAYKKQDMMQLQEGIAKELIRFHVRANSDSDSDQALKLKVKDSVITYLQPILAQSQSLAETRRILEDNIDTIKNIAFETLRNSGSHENVSVYFEKSYFPMKTYGDATFPPGEYEAFRIDIGQNQGKNWWCVLYPPLCFVDATHGTLPTESKEQLKNVLSNEEYSAVTGASDNTVFQFKYLKFLNAYFK